VPSIRERVARNTRNRATADVGRIERELEGVGADPSVHANGDGGWATLTATELRVVRSVAEGNTNRDVGRTLMLPPEAVSAHLRHAFEALGVTSRVELTRLVRERDAAEMVTGVDSETAP
jgi:DNA-binding CsgD family transcriptional regulator